MLGQHDSLSCDSRNRSISREGDSNRLTETVHAVCRVHARAGTAARADILLKVQESCIIDDSGFSGADCLEHLRQGSLFTMNHAGHHRTTGADNCRNVNSQSAHQHARNDLITVRNQNQSVELMRISHGFNTVRDQLSARQRILHAAVPHGDSVTYTDGWNHNRSASRHAYAGLDRLRNLIQMSVSRNNVAVRGNDADQRTLQFFLCISHCVEQTSSRGSFNALCYIVTSACHILLFPFLRFFFVRQKSAWQGVCLVCSSRII